MKKLLLLALIVLSQNVTSQEPIGPQSAVEKVTAFKGQQVTGISLSQTKDLREFSKMAKECRAFCCGDW